MAQGAENTTNKCNIAIPEAMILVRGDQGATAVRAAVEAVAALSVGSDSSSFIRGFRFRAMTD